MKKLYILGEGDGIYDLVADDGEHLASHWCSSKGYARGDLERNRPERQEEWKKRFGEYEVLYLGDDSMTLERIQELNKIWFEANKEKGSQIQKPSIEVTFEDDDGKEHTVKKDL